jgi:hypothetical protein
MVMPSGFLNSGWQYCFMFTKVKTEHHILKEFHHFLRTIEKHSDIQRIIPWRIVREQSGRSEMRINFSYLTSTGLKYKICKWSTAQEIFVIVKQWTDQVVQEFVDKVGKEYI